MNPQQSPSPPALDPKQQAAQQIKGATNVLVTVSANPSVDQLASAIGVTLVLNKLGKHATAVFSGQAPSTIEFLQPEKTFEKTTDSLRDFIIALDKSKADKLRYKVEDKFVKIFITPYHTSLTDKDLEFSQGDFNIDVVIALGVKKREELDQAIVAHGRILHDAAVISINIHPGADIGTLNLNSPTSSSLSEVMVGILDLIKDEQKPLYNQQIATAFLTGIVAETNRFSNAKTTPITMSMAAKLMNAGANQQLIATKLEEPKPLPQVPTADSIQNNTLVPLPSQAKQAPQVKSIQAAPTPSDGALQIQHESNPEFGMPDSGTQVEDQDDIDRIHIDDEGTLKRLAELEAEKSRQAQSAITGDESRKLVSSPPQMGGRLSANTAPEGNEPSSDPLSQLANKSPILNRDTSTASPVSPLLAASDEKTLNALKQSIEKPHTDLKISDVKSGGTLGVDYPEQLVGKDGPAPDKTASDHSPTGPPPVAPPITMATPPPDDQADPGLTAPL